MGMGTTIINATCPEFRTKAKAKEEEEANS